jgi:tRNA pseudouridine65 synthase
LVLGQARCFSEIEGLSALISVHDFTVDSQSFTQAVTKTDVLEPQSAHLRLLFQDEFLVAIDKPPGLLVHRTGLDAVAQDFSLQRLRDQLGRAVWPAHRLDRGTSGVLLFALNEAMASALGQAFEHGRVCKTYLALVRGWPADAFDCDHPLARDPESPSAGQAMLVSRTRFQTMARWEWPIADRHFACSRFALVQAQPETGRRHQIRRHLKHLSHPIVGDATHGKGPLNRAVAQHLGLQRLWLHAWQLSLVHPHTGQTLALCATPGAEWARLPLGGGQTSDAGDQSLSTIAGIA